jgi:hypothetical protein
VHEGASSSGAWDLPSLWRGSAQRPGLWYPRRACNLDTYVIVSSGLLSLPW